MFITSEDMTGIGRWFGFYWIVFKKNKQYVGRKIAWGSWPIGYMPNLELKEKT